MKKIIAGTFALALAPFAATAGGFTETATPAPAPIPTPAPIGTDWSGFYGGAQIEFGDAEFEDAVDDDGDGGLIGVFGGYRYDFGSFVLGGEVDLNAADIELEASDTTIDAVYRVGVEAGYDAGPALIYGTAGYAYAEADSAGTDLEDDGYFFGAGIDYLVSEQFTVGAEILQHEFDDFDSTDIDVSVTTFGINAAFRF
jgi:opacity protein-like surface antigen